MSAYEESRRSVRSAVPPFEEARLSCREELMALAALDPSDESVPYRVRMNRPLEAFSYFVCDELGAFNERVRSGYVRPEDLFRRVESLSRALPVGIVTELEVAEKREKRRTALVDLTFVERSLNVAFGGSSEYRRERDGSDFSRQTKILAEIEGRHPYLSWADIGIHHPAEDPRSFLDDGTARDQEIFLYRVQGAIDRAFRGFVGDWMSGEVSREWLTEMTRTFEAVVAAMAHLTRVREVGQFYQLDPFLSQNYEVRGHGTGSFSPWTFLVGFALSGRAVFRSRLCDETNVMAFDSDSLPCVRRLQAGEIDSLVDRVEGTGCEDELEAVSEKFIEFLRVHKAAVRKHAPDSLAFPAPASPEITNEQSMKDAIGPREERRKAG